MYSGGLMSLACTSIIDALKNGLLAAVVVVIGAIWLRNGLDTAANGLPWSTGGAGWSSIMKGLALWISILFFF